MKTNILCAWAVLALPLAAGAAALDDPSVNTAAQTLSTVPSLDWHTIDGGGGQSSGGGYVFDVSIGQPDADLLLLGGGYELDGGFWPGLSDVIFRNGFD